MRLERRARKAALHTSHRLAVDTAPCASDRCVDLRSRVSEGGRDALAVVWHERVGGIAGLVSGCADAVLEKRHTGVGGQCHGVDCDSRRDRDLLDGGDSARLISNGLTAGAEIVISSRLSRESACALALMTASAPRANATGRLLRKVFTRIEMLMVWSPAHGGFAVNYGDDCPCSTVRGDFRMGWMAFSCNSAPPWKMDTARLANCVRFRLCLRSGGRPSFTRSWMRSGGDRRRMIRRRGAVMVSRRLRRREKLPGR